MSDSPHLARLSWPTDSASSLTDVNSLKDLAPTAYSDVETFATLVDDALKRVAPYVVRTPTIRLTWLDTPTRRVWAKLETSQLTGAFKYRGAVNALLDLPPESTVVTGSAGNHGLAVATAAQRLGFLAVSNKDIIPT